MATHAPAAELPPLHVRDTTLHVIGYFVLTSVFLITLHLHGWGWFRCVAWALPILLVYGGLDELTQPWFNRYAAWGDYGANVIGIFAAIALDALLTALRRRKK